jgi:HK97 family phage major capsid protein
MKTNETNPIKLRQQRSEALRGMKAIHSATTAANRDMTVAEEKRFSELEIEMSQLTTSIDLLEYERDLSGRPASGGGEKRFSPGALSASSGHEAVVYRTDNDAPVEHRHSFFGDLLDAANGDGNARDRLTRNHAQAMDYEKRAGLNTTLTSGGEFAAAVEHTEGYIGLPRPKRPYLDALGTSALPLNAGASFLYPKITTGASVAAQTEAAAVSNTDLVTANLTLNVLTAAGRSVVSQQLRDLGPLGDAAIADDLTREWVRACEDMALNSAATGGKGLTQTVGPTSVANAGAITTLRKSISQAMAALSATGAFCDAEMILANPRMIFAIADAVDATTTRGLFSYGDSAGTDVDGKLNGKSSGVMGSFRGLPVVGCPALSVTGGAGAESNLLVINKNAGHLVLESPLRYKVADQVNISTLQAQIVVYSYMAMVSRLPKAVAIISGVGTNLPAGF